MEKRPYIYHRFWGQLAVVKQADKLYLLMAVDRSMFIVTGEFDEGTAEFSAGYITNSIDDALRNFNKKEGRSKQK